MRNRRANRNPYNAEPTEERFASFLVRLAPASSWNPRGIVEHLSSGSSIEFTNIEELLGFFADHSTDPAGDARDD